MVKQKGHAKHVSSMPGTGIIPGDMRRVRCPAAHVKGA